MYKLNIYQEYIAKFQINDYFDNFTHELIFAYFFVIDLPNIFIK